MHVNWHGHATGIVDGVQGGAPLGHASLIIVRPGEYRHIPALADQGVDHTKRWAIKLKSRRCLQLVGRPLAHPGDNRADSVSHHSVVSLADNFRGRTAVRGVVPGPQAGNNWNRGPGTHSHCPAGSPSLSLGTCACTRYVIRRINSGYLSCGPHPTQYLSGCLVTPASNVTCFPLALPAEGGGVRLMRRRLRASASTSTHASAFTCR